MVPVNATADGPLTAAGERPAPGTARCGAPNPPSAPAI